MMGTQGVKSTRLERTSDDSPSTLRASRFTALTAADNGGSAASFTGAREWMPVPPTDASCVQPSPRRRPSVLALASEGYLEGPMPPDNGLVINCPPLPVQLPTWSNDVPTSWTEALSYRTPPLLSGRASPTLNPIAGAQQTPMTPPIVPPAATTQELLAKISMERESTRAKDSPEARRQAKYAQERKLKAQREKQLEDQRLQIEWDQVQRQADVDNPRERHASFCLFNEHLKPLQPNGEISRRQALWEMYHEFRETPKPEINLPGRDAAVSFRLTRASFEESQPLLHDAAGVPAHGAEA